MADVLQVVFVYRHISNKSQISSDFARSLATASRAPFDSIAELNVLGDLN
jgi:hypothetical protein